MTVLHLLLDGALAAAELLGHAAAIDFAAAAETDLEAAVRLLDEDRGDLGPARDELPAALRGLDRPHPDDQRADHERRAVSSGPGSVTP